MQIFAYHQDFFRRKLLVFVAVAHTKKIALCKTPATIQLFILTRHSNRFRVCSGRLETVGKERRTNNDALKILYDYFEMCRESHIV